MVIRHNIKLEYNMNGIQFKLQNIGSPKKGWFLKWLNTLS